MDFSSKIAINKGWSDDKKYYVTPIFLHFLLGEGYHLPWLDKALSLPCG